MNWIAIYFFKNQRLELIDEQIDRGTRILSESGKFKEAASTLKGLETVISEVMGSERIGKVFLIRDRGDRILFQSGNMDLLQTELPTSPQWVTIQAKDQYVRIFNTPLSSSRLLQVGLVLDHNFVNWSIVNTETVVFITALVIVLFVIAVLLTIVLLSPIRLLNSHLVRATSDLSNLKDVNPLPSTLLRFTEGFWSRSDEFASLIATVERLISRINLNYKLTRSWTLQMAHELKTPLAIVRAETEAERKGGKVPERFAGVLLSEVDWMSETITQFLTWAELENSRPQKTLHVLKVGSVVASVRERLETICKQRIKVDVRGDVSVAASPGHLDQLVTNLLSNACKFAPDDSEITVSVANRRLTVRDRGPGIPPEVLERFGEPFNVGSGKSARRMKGNGLGLAWVKTVSKLYGWRLTIESSSTGTEIGVEFPEIE